MQLTCVEAQRIGQIIVVRVDKELKRRKFNSPQRGLRSHHHRNKNILGCPCRGRGSSSSSSNAPPG
jgi:hypothetical protein